MTKKTCKHGPLTPELVKTFEGFENVTDEEAFDIFITIDTLCRITWDYLQHNADNSQEKCEDLE